MYLCYIEMLMTTSELIIACCNGDPKAQRILYEQYKGRVMGVAKRYAKHGEEASDMFQESWIRIFQYLPNLKEYEKLDGWIKRTSVHTSLNVQKQHWRYSMVEDTFFSDKANNDDRNILSSFGTTELLGLIQELPDGYKTVFNLYVIDGFSHAEIADLLKVSENTSKSQLSRAKEALRTKIEKQNNYRHAAPK
jgi:RNA polymerase sigma factor (sigma-70 family)